MGTLERLYGMSGNVLSSSQDDLQIDYAYTHDVDVIHEDQIVDVFNAAWAAGLPRKRQRLGTTGLFAFDFSYKQDTTVKKRFIIGVQYHKPEALGPGSAAVADLHPIYHPARNTISYIEKELIIEKAYNRDVITGGAARTANTLGYIQNGAGVVSQTPIIEIVRQPVIISRKNIASLGSVLSINKAASDGGYGLSTNSDSVTIEGETFGARRLKFAGVSVGDEQEFDGISFWEAERIVEIHETTDHEIDSVGTQYCNGDGEMVSILQYDGDDNVTENEITEPIPINLDGSAGTPGTSVQITYYYLTEKAYAPLLGV